MSLVAVTVGRPGLTLLAVAALLLVALLVAAVASRVRPGGAAPRRRLGAPEAIERLLRRLDGDDDPAPPPVPHGQQGEARCRALLEQWFGVPFRKVRPAWLENPATGSRLELDMYNEHMRLAVEYNGAHHDVFTPFFHGTRAGFEAQRARDRAKRRLCRRRGVHLVSVGYEHHEPEALRRFLADRLARLGYTLGVPEPPSATGRSTSADPPPVARRTDTRSGSPGTT